MSKKLILVSTLVIAFLIATVSVYAAVSKYDLFKQDLLTMDKVKDPDGKVPKILETKYMANKDKDSKLLKKENEINGFVPDDELAKKGGKYTLKKLMTYREYFDLGIDDTFRHDIDPDRMIWVFTSKFDKTHYIDERAVEKAIVTTLYDAETGEFLGINVKSDDPHGLDNLGKKN